MFFLRTGLGPFSLSIALLGALHVGCGDSSGSGSGGGSSDGGAGGGGTTATTGNGGGATTTSASTTGAGGSNDCNLLVAGPTFEETRAAAPAPASTGGTIVDGTYFWTGSVLYTSGTIGPTGVMLSGAVRFTGGAFEFLSVDATQEIRAAATVTVNGTDLITQYTCLYDSAVTASFTATSTTVEIRDSLGLRIDTYTLQ